jgi:hypothetical protein
VRGDLKKDEICQQIYIKEDVNEVLTFLTCLTTFVERCAVGGEKRDRLINTVDHDSNSDNNNKTRR